MLWWRQTDETAVGVLWIFFLIEWYPSEVFGCFNEDFPKTRLLEFSRQNSHSRSRTYLLCLQVPVVPFRGPNKFALLLPVKLFSFFSPVVYSGVNKRDFPCLLFVLHFRVLINCFFFSADHGNIWARLYQVYYKGEFLMQLVSCSMPHISQEYNCPLFLSTEHPCSSTNSNSH